MKTYIKYIVGYLVAMLPLALGAQTATENHVVSKTYKVKSTAPLTTKNPDSVSTAIQYFDDLGRIKQSVVVKGGSGNYGNNNLNFDWSAGTPTSAGFYNPIGSSTENQIVNGMTPFGDTDLLWECINDAASGPDGGWNSDNVNIDHTQTYRYSVWVRKSGNLTDGVTLHGVSWSKVNNLNGTVNTNPYLWEGDLPEIDTWYLIVGIVHPSSYTGADLGISGVYDTNGNKVVDGREFKWISTTTSSIFRSYLYYATDINTRQYFWNPLVQKVDGSEASLDEILNNSSVYNNQQVLPKDIVTHYEYDQLGQQKKEYLPYASDNVDGRFERSAKERTQNYYLNKYAVDFPGITDIADVNAYSEKIYEDASIGVVIEQTAPGVAWKQGSNLVNDKEYSDGNTIKLDNEFNIANEVKNFNVIMNVSGDTYTPTFFGFGYFGENELSKTITKDENWTAADGKNHTTEEFKNKNGQVVLKRTYADFDVNGDGDTNDSGEAAVAHDTYYIYDDYGNLSFVLPPKAANQSISTTILNELCYQYKYDHRNRLVEKKIPGKGWEYIVYDKLDRPILTQDAIQRAKTTKEWLFTKYDKFGRVAMTGLYKDNGTRTSLQTSANGSSTVNESFMGTTYIPGTLFYYSNDAFPTNIPYYDVYTINYYDEYVYWGGDATNPTMNAYEIDLTSDTKGLATTSKVKVLGVTDKWVTTITGYDAKARPIYVYSKNDYLETIDIVESDLDFTGKALEIKTTYQKTGETDIVTIDRFEYDHMDRLIAQSQKVNSQVSERIVRNNYDDLGQLKSKLTGNGTQRGYTDVTSGITISGDLITKTSGSCWGVGLATSGSFHADGYVEFTTEGINKYYSVGLSSTNIDAGRNSIEYAIYIRHLDEVYVYESGSSKGIKARYTPGDSFKIERIGNRIHYKMNNETFYMSEKLSSGTLLGDVSICYNDAKIKNLHIVDNSNGLQHVDYDYNVRGWLKHINEDNQNDNDLFNFTLRYNDPTSGTPLFNGNISQTSWHTANTDSSIKTYTFSYDALNRITSGIDNTENYNLSMVNYDKNGNILRLKRQGHTNVGATTFGIMDDLHYTYAINSNQLSIVRDDAVVDEFGFKDDAVNQNADTLPDFAYDINGNMTKDDNKGITAITYNHLNLPTKVTFPATGLYGGTREINYIYDAAGMKLSKEVVNITITGAGPVGGKTFTFYAGNYVYERYEDVTPPIGGLQTVLQFFNHAEGYVKVDVTSNGVEMSNVYQYKDHLGNIRLSYADTDNNGIIDAATEIIEESNYYPFGLKHQGYNSAVSSNGNSVAQKWNFLGQESNDELGLDWLTFRHRNYMPEIGRFFGVDPVSADYVNISTYQFAHNSPIWKIELEGLEGLTLSGVDISNAPPSSDSSKNPARHLPLPVGNQSGNSSVRKASRLKTSGDTMQAKNGEAYVAKGSIEGNYGLISTKAEGRFLGVSGFQNTGKGELNTAISLGFEASLADASMETSVGFEHGGFPYRLFGGGRVSLGKVTGQIEVGAFTGEGDDVGVKGMYDFGAYSVEGEYFAGVELPFFKGTATIGTSAGSIHAGKGFNGTINDKTGKFTFEGFEHFGIGVGQKASFKVEADIILIDIIVRSIMY